MWHNNCECFCERPPIHKGGKGANLVKDIPMLESHLSHIHKLKASEHIMFSCTSLSKLIINKVIFIIPITLQWIEAYGFYFSIFVFSRKFSLI